MDQDTKQAAVQFLTLSKAELAAAREKKRRAIRDTLIYIAAARRHGMTWDEIAEPLGHPSGHAARMWYRRSGGKD